MDLVNGLEAEAAWVAERLGVATGQRQVIR
jgi:hypothetical protein